MALEEKDLVDGSQSDSVVPPIDDAVAAVEKEVQRLLDDVRVECRIMLDASRKQAAEILLQAEQQAAERLHEAEQRAAERLNQAEQQVAERLDQAEQRAVERLNQAEQQVAERLDQAEQQVGERLNQAEQQAQEILELAQREARNILPQAERQASDILRLVEKQVARIREEALNDVMPFGEIGHPLPTVLSDIRTAPPDLVPPAESPLPSENQAVPADTEVEELIIETPIVELPAAQAPGVEALINEPATDEGSEAARLVPEALEAPEPVAEAPIAAEPLRGVPAALEPLLEVPAAPEAVAEAAVASEPIEDAPMSKASKATDDFLARFIIPLAPDGREAPPETSDASATPAIEVANAKSPLAYSSGPAIQFSSNARREAPQPGIDPGSPKTTLLIVSPFSSFRSLTSFRSAVESIKGVRSTRIQSFDNGTLYLVLDIVGVFSLDERLLELKEFRPVITGSQPGTINLSIDQVETNTANQ